MVRTLLTLFACFVAVLVADIFFRGSVLQSIRPMITLPPEQGIQTPPVQVEWDGPARMRVLVGLSGGDQEDLGVQSSPVLLDRSSFPREGMYQVSLQSPRFGSWIGAKRRFQIYAQAQPEATPAPTATPADPFDRPVSMKDLLRALRAARNARERASDRAKSVTEENAALREESERLAQQLESLSGADDADTARVTELEQRLTQLGEVNRGLAEENAALRLRLSAANTCTVWGYYSYVRPNTIPVTKRLLLVSDIRGQIFRGQADCEVARHTDATAGSLCFCVGSGGG